MLSRQFWIGAVLGLISGIVLLALGCGLLAVWVVNLMGLGG